MQSRELIAGSLSRGLCESALLIVSLLTTGVAVQRIVQGHAFTLPLGTLILPGLYFFAPAAGCIALAPRSIQWFYLYPTTPFEAYLHYSAMPAMTLMYLLVVVVLSRETIVSPSESSIQFGIAEVIHVMNWAMFFMVLAIRLRLPSDDRKA